MPKIRIIKITLISPINHHPYGNIQNKIIILEKDIKIEVFNYSSILKIQIIKY